MKYDDAMALAASLKGQDSDHGEFFAVDDADVVDAESQLGKRFPDALKRVWNDLGSGFFYSLDEGGLRSGRVLILMSPEQIVDVIGIHDDRFGPDVPFFDLMDDEFLVLKPDGTIENAAWPGVEIAGSAIDFIVRMFDDALFWRAFAP